MDEAAFRQVLASMDNTPPAPPAGPTSGTPAPQASAPSPASGSPPRRGMSDEAFNAVLASMEPPSKPSVAPGAPPQASAQPDPASISDIQSADYQQDMQQDMADGTLRPPQANPEPGLSDPSAPFVDAPISGAARAVYETKDFVAGETPQGERSSIRKAIEAGPGAANAGLGYALSQGVSQFAVGMLGAGKLMKAAQGVKAVGSAIEAVQGARTGTVALESAKAASVGAVAFDPHGQRLSNLVQEMPMLANPINGYLAAKPDDSAAMGRMKNAMESIGLDAATIGILSGGVSIYRAMRSGDAHAVEAASTETQRALDQASSANDSEKAVEGHQATAATTAAADPEVAAGESPSGPSVDPAATNGIKVTQAPDPGGDKPGDVKLGEIAVERSPVVDTHIDHAGQEFERSAPNEPWTLKSDQEAEATSSAQANSTRAQASDAGIPKDDTVSGDASSGEAGQGRAEGAAASDHAAPGEGGPSTAAHGEGFTIPDPQMESLSAGIQSDLDAFAKFGSWDAALDNVHVFGKGGSIPYQKLADGGDGELSAFISRTAEVLKEPFDEAKGGAVLSDERVAQLVRQRVQLYGEDPAQLLGTIQAAGHHANDFVANMEAAYSIAQRAGQDATTLAMRMRVGALDEFGGSHALAADELKRRVFLFSQTWSAGQAMRSASGRAMRRLRADFRLSPEDLKAIKDVDPDALVNLLATTGGDPRAIKTALNPTLLRRVTDWAQFLYVNNLLWGLRTHAVNLTTNAYMLFGRPMERILGSMIQSKVLGEQAADDALRIRYEAQRQYSYMGTVLGDSWKAAVETWRLGDSVIHPHHQEALNQGVIPKGSIMSASLGTQVAQLPFKSWDSIANVLHNTFLVAAPKTLGMPTRALGMADELVKQVVYRSKVSATAEVEGLEQGLEGSALTAYIRNRLDAAFDGAGRAVDQDALREAQIATFQQDLLPGTLGSGVQKLASENAVVRFVLPFVKTPANVIRMGVKLSPGLNVLQKEYRDMLTGEMGREAQAQAIGQMSIGSLFTGFAAYLASQGRITGGGPSDPKAQAALKATGWQPYSFVTINADGSRNYINYGRYDPMAMPFGMVADIIDVLAMDQSSATIQKSGSMLAALTFALSSSISQKTYLKQLDETLQALTDPDQHATRTLGGMAANMLPMSSNLRQLNTDPYMREARTFIDYMKATMPGFSETLPARRDMFGDPVSVHKGFWVTTPSGDFDPHGMVDSEIRRLASRPGEPETFGAPSPRYKGGVDLRGITLVDGRNAYDVMQQLARQPTPNTPVLKDTVAKVMQTDGYQRAPDGDAKTQGTKMAIIANVLAHYRHGAESMMLADKNVRDAAFRHVRDVQSAYANQKTNPTAGNAANAARSNIIGGLTKMVSPMLGQALQ